MVVKGLQNNPCTILPLKVARKGRAPKITAILAMGIVRNTQIHLCKIFKTGIFNEFCQGRASDEVAEWLRRWTANPLGSARVGSNPILVVYFSPVAFYSYFNFDSRSLVTVLILILFLDVYTFKLDE